MLVDLWAADLDGGSYEIPPGLSSGNYKVYLRVPGSLRKRVDVTYDSSVGLSGVDATLLFGDLNGDNYVSQAEVDFVYANISTTVLPYQWDVGDNYSVGLCDFNRDGSVTSADYNLASPNVGYYGD